MDAGGREQHEYDIRTLLSWNAPGRPFRKKGRQFFLSVLLILFFFEVILFLFTQYELMLVVLALAFLSVALSITPPHNFHYKITTEGIKVEDYFYIWRELYDFYFRTIEGQDVLILRTQDFLPGELKIMLDHISREHVRKILVQFIPYREYVKPTFMEKSGEWLSQNFPLEAAEQR
ncbi:MAG TPA: hypothetical protein VG965_00055 [Patescibacteria group bacterium]|nr:hypothetical protein [Patescibacteria group bacterium]